MTESTPPGRSRTKIISDCNNINSQKNIIQFDILSSKNINKKKKTNDHKRKLQTTRSWLNNKKALFGTSKQKIHCQ